MVEWIEWMGDKSIIGYSNESRMEWSDKKEWLDEMSWSLEWTWKWLNV